MDQADKLREKVELLKEQAPSARVITVTSGKGGVGKTQARKSPASVYVGCFSGD